MPQQSQGAVVVDQPRRRRYIEELEDVEVASENLARKWLAPQCSDCALLDDGHHGDIAKVDCIDGML